MTHGPATSDSVHPVLAKLAGRWPPAAWADLHVVLAVSGGADSVALLRAVHEVKTQAGGRGKLLAAHFNHGVRLGASDEDQAWVVHLCHELEIDLEVGRPLDRLDIKAEDGFEAAARRARYDFLLEVAERHGARQVATAHTRDDQVETVLHHTLRGTGLTGLCGMPANRPLSENIGLVRPLLDVTREEILDYLKSLDQGYRIDETNSDPHYTRNRLRHKLLPLLRDDFNPHVDEALLRLAAQAEEAQQVMQGIVGRLKDLCVSSNSDGRRVEIRRNTLLEEDPIIVRELCKAAWTEVGWPVQAMGYKEWESLAALLASDEPRPAIILPGKIRAERTRDSLVLERMV